MAFKAGMVHQHRNVQGGWARAAVFGVSDGLVSNVALILGFAGASTDAALVRVAGVAGLLAGAVSMAAGEYISITAQNELVVREIDRERQSLIDEPFRETMELANIYEKRGLGPDQARRLATAVHADPDVALDVHTREELGVDPADLAKPVVASGASLGAFAVGAFLPLIPWLFGGGAAAVIASIIIGAVAAAVVGAVIAIFTERSRVRTALRQVLVAAVACAFTSVVGSLLGANIS
ncbi:MAG TPA: VIT1/CCC1 transporter family protein [Acidimicrobiales bacterium]|nr:VIT1/CCC1 transporter family protein [Acidimicrobiales bacterium]